MLVPRYRYNYHPGIVLKGASSEQIRIRTVFRWSQTNIGLAVVTAQ